jgi:hypothetical protein
MGCWFWLTFSYLTSRSSHSSKEDPRTRPVLVLRGWYYFRVGVSGYISMAFTIVNFLFVSTLYFHTVPALANLRLIELAPAEIALYTLGGVVTGYLHTKKQMNTDNQIATLQNPFLYSIVPGKETLISYPALKLNLEVSKRFARKEGIMDKDLEEQFSQMESLIKRLLAGEALK